MSGRGGRHKAGETDEESLRVGSAVEVWFNEKWWQAKIVAIVPVGVKIQWRDSSYGSYVVPHDECGDRLRVGVEGVANEDNKKVGVGTSGLLGTRRGPEEAH